MAIGNQVYQRQRVAQRQVALTLSLFRYFSFMVGVGMLTAWPSLRGEAVGLNSYLVLGVVGLHLVVRVFLPGPLHPGGFATYAAFGVDLAIALGATAATGGLDSGLLLYSLVPVLTASLLLEERLAWLAAGANLIAVLAFQIISGPSSLLAQNPMAILLLYFIAVVLLAVVPYRANLNLRLRLETEATEEERRRLRREIHDNLAQDVGALNLQARHFQESLAVLPPAELAREVSALQKEIQEVYSRIRWHMEVLSLPGGVSVASALAEVAENFSASAGIPIETSLARDTPRLSPRVEAGLLAIAGEALTNVKKHAGAGKVWLSITSSPWAVELVIKDNGRGFDSNSLGAEGHYGLVGMRERAEEIGGELRVTSAPGQGTEVRVVVALGRESGAPSSVSPSRR